MAHKTAQDVTLAVLKDSGVTLNFKEMIQEQQDMLLEVKQKLKADFDSVDEKFFKKYEEKEKELTKLAESWIKKAYPESGNTWLGNCEITILIEKTK
jgi:hypothetical protein